MGTARDMKVFAQAPGAALRQFVKRLLVVNYPDGHRDSHLPGTGLVAAFRLSGSCVLNGSTLAPDAAITGLWDTARTHDHSPGNTVALVQFTAVGAAALLRRPLDEFGNATIALADALDRPAALPLLHERLVGAPNHGERLRLLDDFLTRRMAGFQPDPLISAAVAWIARTPSPVRIAALTRHIGLSQSALERRFRRQVGTSPKKFASIVRLQHVVRLREAGNDLTSIAHAAGYFDQPHFIKDFRRFTGQAPETYLSPPAANCPGEPAIRSR